MNRLRRVSWGIVDQALVSLASALVTVQGAATLPAADFGVLATALAAFYLALSVVRGMVSEVYILRFAAARAVPLDQPGGAQATTVLLALAMSLVLVATAMVNGDGSVRVLLALVVALPFLLLQDVRRAILVSSALTRRSAASSALVLVGQLVGGAALHVTHRETAPALLLVWASAAATGIMLVRIPGADRVPIVTGSREWLRHSRPYWPPLLTEALSLNGASQVPIFLVAGLAGTGVVAGLRAAVLLLAPMTVLHQAVGQLIVAEAARVDRARLPRFSVFCQAAFLAAWILWVSVLLASPNWILAHVVGASLPSALVALPGMTAFAAANMLAAVPAATLRVTGGLGTAVATRLLLIPPLVGAPILLAAASASTGQIAGGFGAYGLCSLVVWNTVSRRSLRRSAVCQVSPKAEHTYLPVTG